MTSRFTRQELLAEVGPAGQKTLSDSRVLVVGIGGLGCPAAQYLASMGVGKIGLIDGDTVEESNLNRQILFGPSDLGKNKAQSAAQRLQVQYPDISFSVYSTRLTAANAEQIIGNYDLVVDGTDSFTAKFLINDACVKLGRPFVWAAAIQLEGRMAVFWPGRGPCYRCLQPQPPRLAGGNCNELGVLGGVPGLIGTWQAIEAVKTLIRLSNESSPIGPRPGLMLTVAFDDLSVFSTSVPTNPRCSACSEPSKIQIAEEDASLLCTKVEEMEWHDVLTHRYLVVDVREKSELTPTDKPWLNVPLSLIQADPEAAMKCLGEHASVAFVCASGMRSRRALSLLARLDLRRKFVSVRGGVSTFPTH